MKFLNIFKNRDSWYTLAPEKRAELEAVELAWTEKQLRSGKIKEAYLFGNGQGAVCIWDVASTEDMIRTLMEWPKRAYEELEVTPLIEWDVVAKVFKGSMEAAKKETPR